MEQKGGRWLTRNLKKGRRKVIDDSEDTREVRREERGREIGS